MSVKRKFPKGHCNTQYKKKYCKMIKKHLAEGGSIVGFADKLKHQDTTLYSWRETYPEFKESWDMGIKLGRERYIKQLEELQFQPSKDVNNFLIAMIGVNRYKLKTEKIIMKEMELKSNKDNDKDGEDINININIVE